MGEGGSQARPYKFTNGIVAGEKRRLPRRFGSGSCCHDRLTL